MLDYNLVLFYPLIRSSAWIGEGSNWCAPYKGWKVIYENSPLKIIKSKHLEDKKKFVLGDYRLRVFSIAIAIQRYVIILLLILIRMIMVDVCNRR